MLITSATLQELELFLQGQPKFRAKQLFKALYGGAKSFSEISTFSKELRDSFTIPLFSTKIIKELVQGSTCKFLIELHDGLKVECVLLQDKNDRKTACVSCQVGCGMGCTFCKTGTLGFTRNLEAGEIVEQVLHLSHKFGTIDNVVFMGMGEPTQNLDNVLKSITLLSDENALYMSKRRFTISTCGICSGIKDLADKMSEVRLAFSLVSADQELREKLMPTAKRNHLEDLKEALIYYQERGGRRITLEVALFKDVNTGYEDAKLIANFARGLECMVNLIPWNKIDNLPFETPSENEIRNFENMLSDLNVNTERRFTRGDDIGAACGQLG